MSPSQGPVVPRRRLGGELRRLREDAGLLLEDVAERLECSTSKISRLETGKGIPKSRDVRDLLDIYGTADRPHRERLMRLAREGQQQGWWSEYSDVLMPDTLLPDHLDRFLALESDASSVAEYQQSVVPGLLQTSAYARAVIGVLTEHDRTRAERLVRLRLQRQRALTRKPAPLRLRVVIDEGVLVRQVGGVEVTAGQLAALLKAARRRTLTIQVLPFAAGAHQAIAGSFSVLHFEDSADRDVVYLESHTGDTYLENGSDVARYEDVFSAVSRQALTPADSMELIRAVLGRLR